MRPSDYQQLAQSSHLSGANGDYLESLYEQYLDDASQLPRVWQDYFADVVNTQSPSRRDVRQATLDAIRRPSHTSSVSNDQEQANALIDAYRRFGHYSANINPLGSAPEMHVELRSDGAVERASQVVFDSRISGRESLSGKALITKCKTLYCSTTGYEIYHLESAEERRWWYNAIESIPVASHFDSKTILVDLVRAELLERTLASRYVGQKRFGLEGGESLIAVLNHACRLAAPMLDRAVIAMAHRGRLNVILNVMGQPSRELFNQFDGKQAVGETSSDVKYHMGRSCLRVFGEDHIHLNLCFNPSHLEAVYPVALGAARAHIDHFGSDQVLPIVIHGDAAFTGQGVVMETLNLAKTTANDVGGTLHIVINNQIGYTTDQRSDARSSHYCSDVMKMINAPIIHVNGDDPEACVRALEFAMAYRQAFRKDVCLDIVCYRRLGHNEGDEPSATQPLMYQTIRQHPTTRKLYETALSNQGVLDQAQLNEIDQTIKAALKAGDAMIETVAMAGDYHDRWCPYTPHPSDLLPSFDALTMIKTAAQALQTRPDTLDLQRQVGQLMTQRDEMAAGKRPINWGFAESLAYASILQNGHSVRLLGQDAQRGTFAHRHAVLHDQTTGAQWCPLQQIAASQGQRFMIYNSALSEYAAMGFEYGYSITDPNTQVIWEAQFGDFANGAQIIIDQFLSSGWQKWSRLSGLTLLLPHGYEGMGPEHSSARLERFLQLCAENNLRVCTPTTPAQIYHLLRQQCLNAQRIPLVVMSPKSLLRHPMAVSTLESLCQGGFESLIDDMHCEQQSVRHVILCSGKVYYDLHQYRLDHGLNHVAIVRIESLYPFPYEALTQTLSGYLGLKTVCWCQEEPKNQGAWFTTQDRLRQCLPHKVQLTLACRPVSASPAAGYASLHATQQANLIEDAFKS